MPSDSRPDSRPPSICPSVSLPACLPAPLSPYPPRRGRVGRFEFKLSRAELTPVWIRICGIAAPRSVLSALPGWRAARSKGIPAPLSASLGGEQPVQKASPLLCRPPWVASSPFKRHRRSSIGLPGWRAARSKGIAAPLSASLGGEQPVQKASPLLGRPRPRVTWRALVKWEPAPPARRSCPSGSAVL